MGIVNRTPDSFYDGGRTDLDDAVGHALRLVEEGATILDVGGVKAGPGPAVSELEELDRVVPLVEAIHARTDTAISVETSRPPVARAAIEAGAGLINDVSELADPGLARACAETGAALALMHHGGQVRGRPRHPRYDDVVAEVMDRLAELARTATECGVPDDRLLVDPGLDFGKNTFHSLELCRRLSEMTSGRYPVLFAPSRKDVVGETLGLPPDERLEGTLALVALAAGAGCAVIRVHDVRAAERTVRMVEAVTGTGAPVSPIRGLWD